MEILVADDSKVNLTLLSASLKKLGHEVLEAQSGEEAIKLFEKKNPDLVILDVVMSEMDGFECAKKIRALCREDWIPIIFLSASVDDESISKGIDAGGDDYLSKPFSEITLAAKIKAMQRIAEMRKNLYDTTQKLTTLSSTDTLTNVYNRLQFNKTIKEKMTHSDRVQGMFALLLLDLDNFKKVNDTLGHPVGDLLLIEVSKRLLSCIRLDDFLARMGGDEFAIILNGIDDKESVHIVAQKIIDILSKPYTLDGKLVHSSASIGIVFYPEDGIDQESLTKNADLAMYYAKKSGNNNFQYYNKKLFQTPSEPNPGKPSKEGQKNNLQVLNCLINETQICIDLRYIRQNLLLPQLKEMPDSPAYLIGLMNLNSRSVPVIDLGLRLNMKRNKAYSLDTPIILCSNGRHQMGFVVDKILGLWEIKEEEIQTQKDEKKVNPLFMTTLSIKGELSLLLNMGHLLNTDLNRKISEADLHESFK